MPRSHLTVVLAAVGMALTGCGTSGNAADGISGSDAGGRNPKVTTTRPPSITGTVFADPRFGFTFRYPRDWSTGDFSYDAALTAGARPAASMAVGVDKDNSVLLTRYNLAKTVTARELRDQLVELDTVITDFAGRPYVGEATEIGGLPAVRYQPFALRDDPAGRSSRVVFLFDGTAEYELNCQSTASGRDKMNPGCDQMLSTLRRR